MAEFPSNGISPKRNPVPKWRNSAKRESGTIGESRQNGNFPPLGESSSPNGSISPFGRAKNAGKSHRFCSVRQKSVSFGRNHPSKTPLACVLTQNSVKTVSLMGWTFKIAQNAINFVVWPITHKTESSQKGNSPLKRPKNHRRILHHRPNSITQWGQRGSHSPHKKTERLPKDAKGSPSQPAAKSNRQLRKLSGSQNHKGERGIPSTIDGFSLNPQKTGKTPSMGEEGASFHQNGTMKRKLSQSEGENKKRGEKSPLNARL